MRGLFHVTGLTLAAFAVAMAVPVLAGGFESTPQGAHQAAPPPAKPERPAKLAELAAKPAGAGAKSVGETAGKAEKTTPSAETKAEGKPPTRPGARSESSDGAASLEEVLSRINKVVGEHSAKALGAAADAGTAPPNARAKARSPKIVTAKTRPPAMLKWDPALTSGGVALSWDDQLNPRRVRAADLGVRLVWSARTP